MSRTRPTILYDGNCAFCRACAGFARRRVPAGRCAVVAWQDAAGLTPALRIACLESLHAVAANGRVYSGARAVLFGLAVFGHRRCARELARPPWIPILEAGYRLVAGNRGRLGRLLRLSPY